MYILMYFYKQKKTNNKDVYLILHGFTVFYFRNSAIISYFTFNY